MGKGKKIGIGIGIAILLLFAIGIANYSANLGTGSHPEINGNGLSEPTPVVVDINPDSSQTIGTTKSVLDLLPIREDIGTEWRISPVGYNNTSSNGYFGNSDAAVMSSNTIAQGYEDGVTQDFSSGAVLKVAVATFDSKENAKNYHNSVTTRLYNEGGFDQLATSGINADCFSVFKELSVATISEFYCLKENVYYSVKEYGGISAFSENVKQTTTQFSQIIANKITGTIASNQQLGSLKLVEFAQKLCTSGEGCTTTVALANHDISACSNLPSNNGCISAYAIKFNQPEDCSNATNALDCFKTVSLSLGSAICSMTQSEGDRVECGKHYIGAAQLRDHYRSDEIREVCSPDFMHINFVVQQIACKIEQLDLEEITDDDLLTWKTNDRLTICSRFPNSQGENEEEYCLSSIGVYLKDLSVCDQAGVARGECYGFVAVTEDSIGLDKCDRLGGQGNTFCYMHVAYRMNDISICDRADTNKENCIRLVNSRNV